MTDEREVYEKYEVDRLDGKAVGECFVLEVRDPDAGNQELADGIRQAIAANR